MTTLSEDIAAAIARAEREAMPAAAVKHLEAARGYAEAAEGVLAGEVRLVDASKLPPLTGKQIKCFSVLSPTVARSHAEVRDLMASSTAMDTLSALEREGYASKSVIGGMYRWRALASGMPRLSVTPYGSKKNGPREEIDLEDLSPLALRTLRGIAGPDGPPECEDPRRRETARKQLTRLKLATCEQRGRSTLWAITARGRRLLAEGRVPA